MSSRCVHANMMMSKVLGYPHLHAFSSFCWMQGLIRILIHIIQFPLCKRFSSFDGLMDGKDLRVLDTGQEKAACLPLSISANPSAKRNLV